ncbi:ATP-grasp domain-containing protein [Dactylosporangium sp. NPDC048998]|uniref:preATP grasp domain-containing protein n=1 Tax=Dactylosporangium sp. NPDC048998 TaxID=3363976 RepID=UPI0037197AA1
MTDPTDPTFTARLKRAVVGDASARFVYLNNFEVERVWGRDEPGLPGAGLTFTGVTVNRMEECGVLLADDRDAVVLKAPVDDAYLAYLRSLDLAAGRRMIVDRNEPAQSVTANALDSPRLLAALAALADGGTYLMPLGVSPDEERLSAVTGLPLAAPGAAVCKRVNGKIFSRELVDAAGLTPVPGTECRTVAELAEALRTRFVPGDGVRVVVKESLGVSGRGMVVLDRAQQAERLLRSMGRYHPDGRASLVVERWIDKACDLNYQFIVGRDGAVHFETVKTALVDGGVHRGHLFPPTLRPEQTGELEKAAAEIGRALAAEGYFGLVGVDAMLGVDGTLYPCLEINARFNMATYQNRVAERLLDREQCALATVFDLRPRRTYGFEQVVAALGDLALDAGDRRGVLINNFATLNAAVVDGEESYGRLYGICIGETAAEVRDLRDAAEAALTKMVVAGP